MTTRAPRNRPTVAPAPREADPLAYSPSDGPEENPESVVEEQSPLAAFMAEMGPGVYLRREFTEDGGYSVSAIPLNILPTEVFTIVAAGMNAVKRDMGV